MGASHSVSGSNSNDKVDPDTGLTQRQKKLVQNTWSVLRKNPVASGVAIMTAFFRKYPDYQKYFKAFDGVPLDELAENKRFQAHSSSVVTALNNVIDSLNDTGLLVANLTALGERHGRRGLKEEHFNNLKSVVLEVLAETLTSKFTADVSEAWIKTLDAAYHHIFQGLTTSE